MTDDRKEKFKIKKSGDVAPEDDQLGENKHEAFGSSNEPIREKDKKR